MHEEEDNVKDESNAIDEPAQLAIVKKDEEGKDKEPKKDLSFNANSKVIKKPVRFNKKKA